MEEKSSVKQTKKSTQDLNNVAGKRCLMVLHRFWPFLGGSERQFLKWAQVLDEKDCRVDVFTTNVWDNDYFYYPEKKYIKESTAKIGKNITIRRFKISHLPNKNACLKFLSKFPGKAIKFLIGSPYIFVPGYYIYMFFITFFMSKRFNFVIAGVFPHYYLIYPAYLYAKVKKIPFILVPLVHFGEPNSDENFDLFFNEKGKYLLKNCDYILTITNYEKEKLTANGINPAKIKVSGIGIDKKIDVADVVNLNNSNADNYKTDNSESENLKVVNYTLDNSNTNNYKQAMYNNISDSIGSEKFKEKYNINSPYVLQISTQTHDKGSHHTVEAMKILWEKGFDIKLVLIGQILAEFEQYLISQKSYVFENTIILNYASEEDKNNAIEGCEVFVMPSKSDSFGLVYVEAWLHEKPVIAAYCGGVMEVIDEGINGFFVPFGDYEMIAGYILKLVQNKELAQKMGKEGYKKAENNYLWDQRIKGFNKLIEGLKL
ncbi:MAG: glycosyltransferase family 4 protein [Actinobacteria bacterium]|nr:glycosyltransferase family 4 protein [Cyanobacteriota bacterium]MCL6088280.1 glycosyltransferase family 4 protein [Actinomycetota bacterium]